MRKYPIYLQDDEVSCGVYCIKMILKYYDIEEDTLNIKRKARIDHTGTTIKCLVETMKSYAIEAKAYHASLKDKEEHITLPCILHTIEDGIGHFVVLYEIKGDTYIIGDPAHGIVVYDQEELTSIYTENVVSITHIGRYFEYENKTFKQFLKEIKKLYHKDIRKLGSYTFFITLFSYVLSLIYASLIDYMKVKTPIVVLMIVSGAYFIIGLIKIGIEKTKEKKSILLTRAFDKEFVYTSISQVMDHKGDTGTLHPQIMDLYQLSEFCIAYSTQLSLVLIIVLVTLGIFVYFKSKHFIELYKDYIAAHNESEHALFDYLDQREIGKRYYGKHQWLKRYEHYYENEANHKQDQEEFSLTLSTGMHMIQILGEALILFVGLFLYHNKSITMGELILFYMVYNMILIPLIHLSTTLVEYSQSTVLYEKYKELTTPVVQGKLLVEEPIHTIYMNNVSYAYGFHEPVLNHLDLEINHSFFIFGDNGSGKSTLVNDILCKALRAKIYRSRELPGKHKEIRGIENIDKVIEVSQEPIGRTPRSNPVTYTGVFDDIRDLFAKTPEAKIRGYDKGRFSFNVKGGRCEACQGDGVKRISMNFLPDVYVPCEECHGHRYNEETLQVTYKDKNIYDVLEMTVEESLTFFENLPRIHTKLQALYDVGLGYVKLGQSATTLSGGEAQRVKLASELQKRSTGKTLYILDEPTTGLHSDDVNRLIAVLQKIVDNGDTVLVIEHNLDVI